METSSELWWGMSGLRKLPVLVRGEAVVLACAAFVAPIHSSTANTPGTAQRGTRATQHCWAQYPSLPQQDLAHRDRHLRVNIPRGTDSGRVADWLCCTHSAATKVRVKVVMPETKTFRIKAAEGGRSGGRCAGSTGGCSTALWHLQLAAGRSWPTSLR